MWTHKHEFYSNSHVQLGDDLVGNTIEILYQRPKRVAMSRDDDGLAALDLRDNDLLPIRNDALRSNLERFGSRHAVGIDVLAASEMFRKVIHKTHLVFAVIPWVVLGRLVETRRWYIVRAAPDIHLIRAMLGDRCFFVQASQCAVVPFVELPSLHDWNPHVVGFLKHMVEPVVCSSKRLDI